jgi:hypothetical protein
VVPPITKTPDQDGSIVVYSWRVIPPGDEAFAKYKEVAKIYGDNIKPPNVPGLKTYMFSRAATLQGGQTLVSDVQWFNSIGTFRAHMGLYGNMSIMTTMMDFVGKAEQSEEFGHFKGYVFGGWNKTWVYPLKLSDMFPKFPPGKWFEFRDAAAGFIRNTESSTGSPPIFVLMEHLVADGKVEEFKNIYKTAAAEMEQDPKVIAMSLTEEGKEVELIDKDKIAQKESGFKSQNLLVSLECYEDLDTLKKAVAKLGGLKDLLEGPSNGYMHPALSHTGEIWAQGDNAAVEQLIKATYHPDSTYKAYIIESGFSNHQTACDGKCPEVTKEDQQKWKDTEFGRTCEEKGVKPNK